MKCEMCRKDFEVWRCRACPGAEVIVRVCPDCHRKVAHVETKVIRKRGKGSPPK